MRGTATAWLTDGPHAGAFVQVEAIDGRPAQTAWFAVLDGGRVAAMPREDVTKDTLNSAGRWHLYGRDGDQLPTGEWPFRAAP